MQSKRTGYFRNNVLAWGKLTEGGPWGAGENVAGMANFRERSWIVLSNVLEGVGS